MKFIDSNVLAYAFYANSNTQRCQEIIHEGGIINTANLLEAYNIIQSETTTERATEAIKGLLKSNLKIVDVNLIFEALKRTLKYERLKFIDLVRYECISPMRCNC